MVATVEEQDYRGGRRGIWVDGDCCFNGTRLVARDGEQYQLESSYFGGNGAGVLYHVEVLW